MQVRDSFILMYGEIIIYKKLFCKQFHSVACVKQFSINYDSYSCA
jgi:hypothetical protein